MAFVKSRVSVWMAAVVAVGALLAIGPAVAQSGAPEWPQAHSDQPADPAVTFGVLPNGLRYAIQRNTMPAKQVALRMLILAGSMQEQPDQEGLAHFLEHMAFRGSSATPDGEVMKTLERLGARVGADTNASTGTDGTIYQFNLANNDQESLDTGLKFLREIASDLTLDPALMQVEKNVVMAEGRARAGPGLELNKAMSKIQLGDHPAARAPIGSDEVLNTASAARMRDFYNAYYRPERAVLVVVGDIDPPAIEAQVKSRFSDWQGKGAAGPNPAPAQPQPGGGTVRTVIIPNGGAPGIFLYRSLPYERPDYSHARAVHNQQMAIVRAAFSMRLSKLNEAAGRPAASLASWGATGQFGVSNGFSTQIGGPTRAADALELFFKAEKQALQFGFSQAELDEAISVGRTATERAVTTAGARTTPGLAAALLSAPSARQVYLSPQQQLDVFNEAVRTMTPAKAVEVFREQTAGEPIVVYYSGVEPQGGTAALQAAMDRGRTAQVAAYESVARKPWTHTNFGAAGQVVERRHRADIDADFIRFANNVRLNFKHTDYDKGQVFVAIQFGDGRLAWNKQKVGPEFLSDVAFVGGGLNDLTPEEMRQLLAGTTAGVGGGSGDDFNELTGGAVAIKDFEFEMQLLTAYFVSPGWKPEAAEQSLARMREGGANRLRVSTAASVLGDNFGLLIRSGDQRAYQPMDEDGWTVKAAGDFIRPTVASAPLDVTVVGDIGLDQVIEVVGKTLGALPVRPDRPTPAEMKSLKFPAANAAPSVVRHKGPADQAAVAIAWPTTDFYVNVHEAHAANVLADIFRARATDRLRSSEGRTYSPSVGAGFSDLYPGYGFILAQVQVQPRDVQAAYDGLYAIAAELAAQDVSADELTRAVGPRIQSMQRSMATNAFWRSTLTRAQTDSRTLDNNLSASDDYRSITAADVRAAAQKWLVRARTVSMTSLPETAASN